MSTMKVAVSGVGGAVGQGVMKCLSISELPVEIYPVDIQPLSAGLFRGVEGFVLPKPELHGGLKEWEHCMVQHGIEALIPGSDYDLIPLATVRDDWEAKGICKVLVSDLELVQTCRDKALTCQRLEKEGIPVPKSAWELSLKDAISWAKSTGYPVVIKPRGGSASQNVQIVQDEEEFKFFFKRTPMPVLQEYLSSCGNREEFTCAVFVTKEGLPIGTFMARRELSHGTTYRAEAGFWPEIEELLLAIGTALRPRGPLNVQLRVTDKGPIPFELNVRCSGTSPIRAYFGYNEPEMLLRHYIMNEQLESVKPKAGYAFRYWNEVFLEGVTYADLVEGQKSVKGTVLPWL